MERLGRMWVKSATQYPYLSYIQMVTGTPIKACFSPFPEKIHYAANGQAAEMAGQNKAENARMDTSIFYM